jgi:hypothetical protein
MKLSSTSIKQEFGSRPALSGVGKRTSQDKDRAELFSSMVLVVSFGFALVMIVIAGIIAIFE